MTAAVLQHYSPSLFQSLPSVGKASTNFKAMGGLEQIHDALFAVVQKHPVASISFGIQLLHRHSDLDDDEFLLEFQGTTVPVKKTEVSEDIYGRIYPVIWGIDSGSNIFAPLEFSIFEDGKKAMPQLDEELASDVAKVLLTFGLEKVLGLALIGDPGTVGVESTHHRANIVRPASLFAKMPKAVEVLWPLPSIDQHLRSFKTCAGFCRLGETEEDHEEVHQRTNQNRKPNR